MSLGQKHYVVCPHCRCELQAKNFSSHCFRVHHLKVTGEEISAVISKMANNRQTKAQKQSLRAQKRRKSEEASRSIIEKITSRPHKCLTTECNNQISSTEEYCDSCKKRNISALQGINLCENKTGCRVCGNPTVPNEDFCYEHLGD